MTDPQLLAQWRARLSGYIPGEKPVSQWCRENGITEDRFYFWQRKLRAAAAEGKTPTSPSTAQWLPVTVADPSSGTTRRRGAFPPSHPSSPSTTSSLTLRIGSASIEVSQGFDAGLLRSIVVALEPW